MNGSRCPICGSAVEPPQATRDAAAPASAFPFCSRRCRQVDLGRWLTGQYAIPGDPVQTEPPEA